MSLLVYLLVVGLTPGIRAFGLESTESDYNDLRAEDISMQERFLVVLGNSGVINLTQLAALAALAAAAILPLLGLAALGLLLCALLYQKSDMGGGGGYGGTGFYGGGGGGGGYGHGHGHSSYSSSYRQFDLDQDWERLSIFDWLQIAEDAYTNFDPVSMECQKKVACELHQNVDNFGPMASTITYYFSYLKYAEVLSIPEDLKLLAEELLDAAERGRTLKKDCGDLYPDCQFSVKKIMDKYGHFSNLTLNEV